MRRLTGLVMVLVVCAAGLAAAGQSKKYGTQLTLKDVTKISAIYDKPAQFDGKRVLVEGTIVDVCAEMGCWLAIRSDKAAQTIRFKVEDGVIVFPMSVRGMHAKVEGVVATGTLSAADQIAQGERMASEMNTTFDPKTVKGPKVTVQIKGEGAVVGK